MIEISRRPANRLLKTARIGSAIGVLMALDWVASTMFVSALDESAKVQQKSRQTAESTYRECKASAIGLDIASVPLDLARRVSAGCRHDARAGIQLAGP